MILLLNVIVDDLIDAVFDGTGTQIGPTVAVLTATDL